LEKAEHSLMTEILPVLNNFIRKRFTVKSKDRMTDFFKPQCHTLELVIIYLKRAVTLLPLKLFFQLYRILHSMNGDMQYFAD
jgi:hypothetical protein